MSFKQINLLVVFFCFLLVCRVKQIQTLHPTIKLILQVNLVLSFLLISHLNNCIDSNLLTLMLAVTKAESCFLMVLIFIMGFLLNKQVFIVLSDTLQDSNRICLMDYFLTMHVRYLFHWQLTKNVR
mgnify:FL=1